MTDDPSVPHRPVRSFVRREGRITPAQARAFDSAYKRRALMIDDGVFSGPGIFNRHAPLGVEIGCGTGAVLLSLAQTRPDCDFVGIEVYRPGLGTLINALDEHALENVRVSSEDAVQLIEHNFAHRSIDFMLILFPDPWPKKRHHKRRLLSAAFLRLLEPRLRQHARLFIATDWEDYAQSIEDAIEQANVYDVLARGVRPRWRALSRYEAKAEREGRSVREFMLAPKLASHTPSN